MLLDSAATDLNPRYGDEVKKILFLLVIAAVAHVIYHRRRAAADADWSYA
ncbi:MAG: hypothetical protein LBR20_02655 [Propionibacteriaceae bacterium]|nr:hypothetical protein [Propionibacteriaceae bacterium]